MIKLSFNQKIYAIIAIFILTISINVWFITSAYTSSVEIASDELDGINNLTTITNLHVDLVKYRLLLNDDSEQSLSEAKKIEKDINVQVERLSRDLRQNQVFALVRKSGDKNTTIKKEFDVEKTWKLLASAASDSSESRQLHIALLDSLIAIAAIVVDESQLVLDPVMDSYYLMLALTDSNFKIQDLIAKEFAAKEIVPLAVDGYVTRSLQSLSKQMVNQVERAFEANKILASSSDWIQFKGDLMSYSTQISALASGDMVRRQAMLELVEVSKYVWKRGLSALSVSISERKSRDLATLYTVLVLSMSVSLLATYFAVRLAHSVVVSVRSASSNVRQGESRLADSARAINSFEERMRESSKGQMSSVHMATSVLRDMSDINQKTTSNMKNANELTSSALEHVQQGSQTMVRLSSTMQGLTTSNRQLAEMANIIGEIGRKTKVINDIVFKTQLLAVNASIEAARAGQYGKGFAVVATEVAQLATTSGQAATEIRKLLDESQAKVKGVVEFTAGQVAAVDAATKDAVDSFENVSGSIHSIFSVVENLANSIHEQEAGLLKINRSFDVFINSAEEVTDISDRVAESRKAIEISQGMLQAAVNTIVDVCGQDDTTEGSSNVGKIRSLRASSRTSEGRESAVNTLKPSKTAQMEPSKIERDGVIKKILAHAGEIHGLHSNSPKVKKANSDRFNWDPTFDIGVHDMNDEHKLLLGRMAKVQELVNNQAKFAEILQEIEALKSYTIEHFSHEEKYLESINYSDLNFHKSVHADLLSKLDDHVAKIKGKENVGEDFFLFLKAWLSAHIKGVDIKYGEFVNKKVS